MSYKSDLIIAPSMLAADPINLENEIRKIENSGAEFLHIDIMDGHFVPNLSFSPDTVRALRKKSELFFDVHLMISEPKKYIKAFADAGADLITIHSEVADNYKELAEIIHSLGLKAGISLKPGTEFDKIKDYVFDFDLVLIMTVEPGFGGQAYISSMNEKISEVRKFINNSEKSIFLQVDGGITLETIKEASRAGADVFVAGSAVFKADNPSEAVEYLKQSAIQGLVN